MNQRIKELAEQCYTLPDIPEALYYRKFDSDKFARLLIEECASRIQNYVDHRIPASKYSELLIKELGE